MWKKLSAVLLLLLLLDVVVWYLIFYSVDPANPSDGMTGLVFTFFTAALNVLAAIIVFFWKRWYCLPLIANAVIVFFLFGFLFVTDDFRRARMLYQTWEFEVQGDNYKIYRHIYQPEDSLPDRYQPLNSFQVYKFGPRWASSVPGGEGMSCEKGDTLFFYRVDSTVFYIAGEHIYGFDGNDEIKISGKFNTR